MKVYFSAHTEAVCEGQVNGTPLEPSFSFAHTYAGRSPYNDSLYFGSLDSYSNCGGTSTSAPVIVAGSPSPGLGEPAVS